MIFSFFVCVDRKSFFKSGIKDGLKKLYATPLGQVVDRQLGGFANLLDPRGIDYIKKQSSDLQPEEIKKIFSEKLAANPMFQSYPRPPGAVDFDLFQKKCNRCGDCIVACPHQSLYSLSPVSGPLLNPNHNACYLCEDYPCIASCDVGALLPLDDDTLPWFGENVLTWDNCLNFPDNREARKSAGEKKIKYCKECEKACPVEDALTIDGKERFPRIASHCTGCGICVTACPALPKALQITW